MTTTATDGAAAATQPQQPSASTGFELYEKMVGEQKAAGKSPTLEQWRTQLRQQLEQLKAAKPGPKVIKDIEAVERACALAEELVAALAAGKKK